MRGPVAACLTSLALLVGGVGWAELTVTVAPAATGNRPTAPAYPGVPADPAATGTNRAGSVDGPAGPSGGAHGRSSDGAAPASAGEPGRAPGTGAVVPSPREAPPTSDLPASLACWGDSLTYGSGGDGTNYPEELAGLTGLPVYNGGEPGQRSAAIAARQGGRPAAATADGGSIPATGSVVVSFPLGLSLLEHGGWLGGTLAGVHGTLRRTPVDHYVFTRSASGERTPVPDGSPFVTDVAVAHRQAGTVIWAGDDDVVVGVSFQVLGSIADMVAYVQTPGRYLVLSLLNGTGSGVGTAAYDEIVDTINPELAAAYGPDHYLDIRGWLVSDGLAAARISPTDQDLVDIADDIPPSSLRDGGSTGHLNALGYRLVAQHIRDFISARGWLG